MEFWFKKSNSDKFLLPVNPESFELTVKHNNTVVNINSVGDINLLGKTGLKEGTISSFFPKRKYHFANNKGRKKNPYDYIKKLESWKDENKPIRLIIGKGVNELVTIETLRYGEQDGTGDVYFDVSVKEYKKVSVEKVKTSTKKTTSKKKATKKKKTTKKKTQSNESKYRVNARSGLNLRTAPNSTIIGAMPNGTVVTSNGNSNGGWLNVKWGSRSGWAYTQYLTKI